MNDRFFIDLKILVLLIIVVLSVWFILGFIFPFYVFKNLEHSGAFGDSFGSVNALFSGLGFVGLVFTIFYQLRMNSENKKQEKFSLYMKLIDDIKNDLNAFEYGNLKGLMVWASMAGAIANPNQQYYTRSRAMFIFLTNLNYQQSHIIRLINTDKLIDKNEISFLNLKITLIYITYLGNLHTVIIDTNMNFIDDDFDALKKSSNKLFDQIEEIQSHSEA